MQRFLVREIRYNKHGKRVGKYVPVHAMNKEEAARKHAEMLQTPAERKKFGAWEIGSLAPGQARKELTGKKRLKSKRPTNLWGL